MVKLLLTKVFLFKEPLNQGLCHASIFNSLVIAVFSFFKKFFRIFYTHFKQT